MKVCILSPSVQKHMVLVSTYIKYFEQHDIEYDFIYPDKYHQVEESNARKTYRFEVRNTKNNIIVISDYLRFIRYAKKIIDRESYDLIIVWTEIAAAIFANYLAKKQKGKFIVVVLDLFDTARVIKNPYILSALLDKAIRNSLFTTVSSPGYIPYLTNKRDYLFVQNINQAILPERKILDFKNGKPITILYSGHISYPDYAMKIIDRFKNDSRFFLRIIGAGSEPLKQYVDSIGCKNAEVFGRFESEDTIRILNSGDIIYNVYGNDKPCEQTAFSNKLYYAALMNVPIIVSPHTYMERITKELGIGYAIDFDSTDNICDALYNWCINFNQEKVRDKCAVFIQDALDSHKTLYDKLDTWFYAK